jgi:excisionase family DNA binding protein
MAAMASPRLLTVSEVAKTLGVHRSSVLDLIHDGQLRSVRFSPNGRHRVPVEAVERLLTAKEADDAN